MGFIHLVIEGRAVVRRLVVFVVLLLFAASIVSVAPVAAAPDGLSAPAAPFVQRHVGDVIDTAQGISVTVAVDGSGRRKVEFVAERSEPGSNDWSHPSNQLPYFSKIVTTDTDIASYTIPAGTLQPEFDYRFRARQWYDGKGGDTTEFGPWSTVGSLAVISKPVSPYPWTPKGDTAPAGNILRADDSARPIGSTPISWYEFEIKTLHEPWDADLDSDPVWSKTVPAQSSGLTEVAVDECQQIPGCTGAGNLKGTGFQLRWRVRAIDQNYDWSDWSRWRFFDTESTQDEYWYIPNRAGSYIAGVAGGDEASGLVASQQYPGVFWFIRDAGGDEDRAKLYAIKIDPATGRLDNIAGHMTREIKVNGVENIDWEAVELGPDGNLWIGDIGDYYRKDDPGLPESEAAGQMRDRNNSAEPDLRVIRVPEPNPYTDDQVTATKVAPFQYPDGQSYNSEAMFWVGDYLYVITKEQPQQVYRFRSWISSDQSYNTLTYVGQLSAGLDPITDASPDSGYTHLALTTASSRAVVFRGPGGAPTSGTEADALVRDLLIDQEASWHYYYRSAGAYQADGTLLQERGMFDEFSQPRQLSMQIEGVAFSGTDLAMISEFGKHVLYVPSHDSRDHAPQWVGWGWTGRSGSGMGLGAADTNVDDMLDQNRPDGVYVQAGSLWWYNDTGNRPGGFYGKDYTVTDAWGSGPAPLGAGDGDEATVINRSNPWHTTDYFRKPFLVDFGDSIPSTIEIDLVVDDGAVVYLNGTPVIRHNMAASPVFPYESDTALEGIWGSAESEIHTYTINNPPLHEGLNWIAVEVHQNDQGSGDTSFDLAVREGTILPPSNFDLQGVVDNSDGLDLDLSWEPVPGALEYRLMRRELREENPDWAELARFGGTRTEAHLDLNFAVDVADYALEVRTVDGWSIPSAAYRIVFFLDQERQVTQQAYGFAIAPVAVTAPPPPLVSSAAVGTTRALAPAAGAAVAEPTIVGEVVVAIAGLVVAAGFITVAVLTDRSVLIDGTVLEGSSLDNKSEFDKQRDIAFEEIVTLLAAHAATQNMNEIDRRTIADECVESVDKVIKALGSFPGADNQNLISGEHPCEGLPIYFPAQGSNHPNAAILRSDAVSVHRQWHYQERKAQSYSRHWIYTTWDDGVALNNGSEVGCSIPDANKTCDEFPNASMMAGGSASIPRPALRWVPTNPMNENSSEGGKVSSFYTACGVQADGDPFIVVPLTDRELGSAPKPDTFWLCNGNP